MVQPRFESASHSPGWVNVLVDYGGQPDIYTYRLPEHLTVEAGDILTVPFGSQQVGAIALSLLTTPPSHLSPDQIRGVEGVVEKRFFAPPYWTLLQRVAKRYQTPLVQVLRTALPPGLLARSQRRLRLCPERIPSQVDGSLSPALITLLEILRRSATGDYTWQYLKRHKISYRNIQQFIQLGWAESYLAPPQPPQPQQRQAVTLVADVADPADLTPRQTEILTILKRHGGDLWLSDALQRCQTTSATLKRLAQKGYLAIAPRERLRTETVPALAADQPKTLTPTQAQVLAAITQCQGATQFLLHGVTGSGKTEVYLQAIAPRLAAGQSALVLVPEIGLTPQLTDRFRRRFGAQVCVYHSGLSDGERYDTWRQCLQPGNPLVIVGTRSAIFLPLRSLGLIVLDEEHDGSYKQDVTPCYHARTVAQWRSELENCPLILGSATPSLETWVQCHPNFQPSTVGSQGEGTSPLPGYSLPVSQDEGTSPLPDSRLPATYLSLPQRIQARPMPKVEVIDMREELHQGNRSIFSRRLQEALTEMKQQGSQGILFIHRRGHSSFVSCRSCGLVMMCPHCDVSLSYHQPHAHSAMTLRCHYCGHQQGHPRHCPDCGSPYLKHFGSGTQRVVNALAEQFPGLNCIRFDSDTTRTKGSHRALLTRFAEGEADVLVGTQMLTKGIDLPQVTLVGIIAADGLLYMNDYWASERAMQVLIQVAGRAGRGDQPGQVLLQTYTPEHPVIEAVTHHAYEPFIAAEWEQRQILQYPPASQLVLLRLSSFDAQAVQRVAETVAQHLDTHLQGWPHIRLGPAPAPILRVARRFRWQILLKFPPGLPLPNLQALRDLCPTSVSLTIDVDPLNLS
jgi:primosomal protein N' (replication factor Y) (superfamily II helicase)